MKYTLVLILILFMHPVRAQEDSIPHLHLRSMNIGKAMGDLTTSLELGEPDSVVAHKYLLLAKELIKRKEYVKAEIYLTRASKLYFKLGNKELISSVNREMAKVQENQNKWEDAITYYDKASRLSTNKQIQALNMNDASRLTNHSNPVVQASYIQKNIDILGSFENKPEERAAVYQQMAEVNLKMNEPEAAITNYEHALSNTKDEPANTIKIKQEIAQVYATNQKQEKALANLQEAYELAIQEGRTLEAKRSLELLVEQCRKQNQFRKAFDLYHDFMIRLEPMVKADSTLIDSKFFQIHEKRIAQLEKERALKDQLIRKKNMFNYVLIGSILLILLCMGFIVRAWYSIKQKNKKIALQSLRREMNPHFIFNSLNSINQFISQNNELDANKYLTSYSRLMRSILENSNKDFIPLSTELELLKEYMDLEYMRFQDKFNYRINIDEALDIETLYVPNMLIQPQIENAIWHGLRYKDDSGILTLTIGFESQTLRVAIEDNGIGLAKSQALKTGYQKERRSLGLANTRERIQLLNSLYRCKITLSISEKTGDESGVVVVFHFPLQLKKIWKQ